MFDVLESLFGTSPSSSTSKVATDTVISNTRKASTNQLSSAKGVTEALGSGGESSTSRNSNIHSLPRRGRQQQRDDPSKSATNINAFVISHSCPPPLHRCGEHMMVIGKVNTRISKPRTSSSEKGPQRNSGGKSTIAALSSRLPSHRMDGTHYRDHSCPPAITSSTSTQQQQNTSTKRTLVLKPQQNNGRSMILPNSKQKTKDLVSVTRDRPNLFSLLNGKHQRRVGASSRNNNI